METKNVRFQIATWLTEMEKNNSYVQLVLKDALEEVAPKDRALANEIIYGTVKYRLQLDYIINTYAKTPTKKMKPFIRNLMRMSVYQLCHLDKIPDSAVINEAVKIIHKRKMSNLSGFVNGVLRNIARNKDHIPYPDPHKDPIKYRSIYYSVPEWIVAMWLKDYGLEDTDALLSALNDRAKVCIRHNPLKATKEAFLAHLQEEGVEITQKGFVEEAYYIQTLQQIGHSASYKKGEWTVQDESAMLVAHVLEPKPSECILDMCSAPGGKTTHIATLMGNTGEVIATDVHEHKIEIIQKNSQRMGLSCIKAYLQDGTQKRQDWHEKFDRIVLDAPCSGLGIIKRKPDIRYSKTQEDLKDIIALQKKLIHVAYDYLKPGGTLVYSTCTLNKDENEHMVDYMVNYGFIKDDLTKTLPLCLKNLLKDNAYIQILPQATQTDGFFIAKLKKEVK